VNSHAGADQGALQPKPELLVEAAWLVEHLNDPALRIVDLRSPEEYQAGHLPGAVLFDPNTLFVDRNGIQNMLPETAELERLIRNAGIGADTTVIGYDGRNSLSAARLFFALDAAGQGKGRVLNGGWDEWHARGLPATAVVTQVSPSDFRAVRTDVVVDVEWVKAHVNDGGTAILDVRSSKEYEGQGGNAKRLGHIPGALWSEWMDAMDPGTPRFRPADELAAMLAARGVTPDKEVAPYCQSMARGAHSYFVLRWLGYPRVRGYDGSWYEWGNRDDTPIEQGPPAPVPPPSGAVMPGSAPAEIGELREGLTEQQVKSLLGDPQQVELQNPCWGKQAVWRYRSAPSTQGPLRLTFLDGILKTIER
jgi:thiosulfate/3-mercaptopyruvate sulfurtransferase